MLLSRRDLLKFTGVLSCTYLEDSRISIPPEWNILFERITSVSIDKERRLPSSSIAGLLILPDGYHILLSKLLDHNYNVSILIHEAWHAYQHSQGRLYYGSLAEREAWSIQALVLSSLDQTDSRIKWLWDQSMIQPNNGPILDNPLVSRNSKILTTCTLVT